MGNYLAQLASGQAPGAQNYLANSPYPEMNQTMTQPVVPYAPLPKGMVVAGNVTDPVVSKAGLRGFEFVHNGVHLETLLPTVVGGKTLNDTQAIARYQKTGQHFGKFETPAHATAFAKQLSGK